MRKILYLTVAAMTSLSMIAQNPFDQKLKTPLVKDAPNSFELIDGSKKHTQNQYTQAYQTYPFVQNIKTQKKLENLKIRRSLDTGMPIYIKGYQVENHQAYKTTADVNQVAFDFLDIVKEELCLENPREEFDIALSEKDAQNYQHIKLKQTYKAIPVYASELIVHYAPDGKMSVNGRHQPTPYIENTTPTLAETAAKDIVVAHHSMSHPYRELNEQEKEMLSYDGPQAELVIYPSKEIFGHFHVAYHITLRPNFIQRFEYFVDAHNGEILNEYNHTCTIGPEIATAFDLNDETRLINTYLYQGNYYLYDASRAMYTGPTNGLPMQGDGGIETLDFQNNPFNSPSYTDIATSNNVWTSSTHKKGVSAHYNAGECYEYFRETHNRNSINGEGGDIVSFINVADESGQGFDNAFWNGQYMFYGNGNQAFKPLAGALDVAGHEMCHGVIQSTANLEYQGESGAINESMADVFGVMIDREDWLLGEDVVLPNAFPSGALRSMSNPNNGATSGDYGGGFQPSNTNEQYTGSQDNGGVHINSGIPNNAFYRIASNSQIGKDLAEDIYYKALVSYLTRSSQFLDLRLAIIESALSLNVTTTQANIIREAFDDVGIFDGAPGNYQEDIEENNGDDFILSLDVNVNDQSTLYVSTTNPQIGSDYYPLTTNAINRKPSITDDGQDVYYVGADDKKVYKINLALASVSNLPDLNPEEFQLSLNNLNWDNVAVSKNGNHLALISIFIDTAIYVYDIQSQNLKKFRLYNPTFSNGVNSGGVLYADAIEWDHTGQYIIYDAYNEIQSSPQDKIDYWDMGVINVWNNQSNSFAEGEITKLFTNLPDNVSIGNPTFSKNSPFIIAFDYLDGNNATTTLKGANLETGQVGDIYENTTLAFASYSTDDSQIIFGGEEDGNEVVKIIDLEDNKIASPSNADPLTLINVAKWPIWFAQGERDLPVATEIVSDITTNLKITPNPFEGDLQINFGLENNTELQIKVYNINGQLVRQSAPQNYTVGQHQIRFETNDLPSGTYIVHLQSESQNQSVKVMKF